MDPSVLLAFPLLLALSTPCSACHCKLQHPQEYYCTSDIVLLVDLLEPGENTAPKRGYKVQIREKPRWWHKILKRPRKLPRLNNIYIPLRSDDCGYQETLTAYSTLLQVQPCRLCSLGCLEADLTDCVWEQTNCQYNSWSENHSLNSMCVPSTAGHCEWTGVQA